MLDQQDTAVGRNAPTPYGAHSSEWLTHRHAQAHTHTHTHKWANAHKHTHRNVEIWKWCRVKKEIQSKTKKQMVLRWGKQWIKVEVKNLPRGENNRRMFALSKVKGCVSPPAAWITQNKLYRREWLSTQARRGPSFDHIPSLWSEKLGAGDGGRVRSLHLFTTRLKRGVFWFVCELLTKTRSPPTCNDETLSFGVVGSFCDLRCCTPVGYFTSFYSYCQPWSKRLQEGECCISFRWHEIRRPGATCCLSVYCSSVASQWETLEAFLSAFCWPVLPIAQCQLRPTKKERLSCYN